MLAGRGLHRFQPPECEHCNAECQVAMTSAPPQAFGFYIRTWTHSRILTHTPIHKLECAHTHTHTHPFVLPFAQHSLYFLQLFFQSAEDTSCLDSSLLLCTFLTFYLMHGSLVSLEMRGHKGGADM